MSTPLRYPLIALLIVAPLAGHTDATLIYQSPDPQGAADAVYRLAIHAERIAISAGDATAAPAVIFDQAQSALIFVNRRYRQFTVISESWMAAARQRIQEKTKQMQARMDKQMEDMPADDRARYQHGRASMGMMPMMGAFSGMGAAPSPPRYPVPSFRNRVVNGISCRHVDIYETGRKVQELCVAEQNAVGIPAQDYATVVEMLRVIDALARNGAFSFGFEAPAVARLASSVEGLSVAVRDLDQNPPRILALTGVSVDPVDPDSVQIPDGYLEAKVPVPGM